MTFFGVLWTQLLELGSDIRRIGALRGVCTMITHELNRMVATSAARVARKWFL